MAYIVSQLLYWGIPTAALLFFAVSLYRFSYAKFRNKRAAGSYGEEELKRRRLLLILSAVILGVLLTVVIGYCLLILTAVAFM